MSVLAFGKDGSTNAWDNSCWAQMGCYGKILNAILYLEFRNHVLAEYSKLITILGNYFLV